MSGKGEVAAHVPAEQVREQITSVLRAWSMAPDLAALTAQLREQCQRAGIPYLLAGP